MNKCLCGCGQIVKNKYKHGHNNRGKHFIFTEEHKKKISISRIGVKLSDGHKKKIGLSMKGRHNGLGYKHTKEAKEKLRLSHIGKKISEKTKEKIRKKHINKILSIETKKKISLAKKGKNLKEKNPFYGKKHSKNTRKLMSLNHADFSGKNHPNWQGGISFEPYSPEFNKQLKEQIQKRDNYRCQECFRHQTELKRKLAIHHIDYNKNNNNLNNLITLCNPCHMQTNFKRQDWKSYYQQRIQGL